MFKFFFKQWMSCNIHIKDCHQEQDNISDVSSDTSGQHKECCSLLLKIYWYFIQMCFKIEVLERTSCNAVEVLKRD